MNCLRIQEELSLLQDGEKATLDLGTLDRHLKDCPACRTFQRSSRETARLYRESCLRGIAALRSLERSPAGPRIRPGRWASAAAGLSAVFLLAFALLPGREEPPAPSVCRRIEAPAPSSWNVAASFEPVTLPTLGRPRVLFPGGLDLPLELWGDAPWGRVEDEEDLPSWSRSLALLEAGDAR